MISDNKIFERNFDMLPVYFGERYYIGDIQLRKQYESDHSEFKPEFKNEYKNESENMELCNDMCSYCMGDQEQLTLRTRPSDTVNGPKTRQPFDTSDGGNGISNHEEAVPVQQNAQAENTDTANQAIGPLNIIAAVIPNEWSIACQMCSTCNRWYQTDSTCTACSSDIDFILDVSLYESENDSSSYSSSSLDDSTVSHPKRKRATGKYNVKNEKSKKAPSKFKRYKK